MNEDERNTRYWCHTCEGYIQTPSTEVGEEGDQELVCNECEQCFVEIVDEDNDPIFDYHPEPVPVDEDNDPIFDYRPERVPSQGAGPRFEFRVFGGGASMNFSNLFAGGVSGGMQFGVGGGNILPQEILSHVQRALASASASVMFQGGSENGLGINLGDYGIGSSWEDILESIRLQDGNRVHGREPVPEPVITSIPVAKFGKNEESVSCSVCQDEYAENDEICKLPRCSHVFHHSCILPWMKLHDSCPVCRAYISGRGQDSEEKHDDVGSGN